MNPNISLSFVAATVEDFTAALAALTSHNATVPTLARVALTQWEGPNEQAYRTQGGPRTSFTSKAELQYGTRENFYAAKLQEFGLQVPETESAESIGETKTHEWSAPEETETEDLH